jgi:hypothetical protein
MLWGLHKFTSRIYGMMITKGVIIITAAGDNSH